MTHLLLLTILLHLFSSSWATCKPGLTEDGDGNCFAEVALIMRITDEGNYISDDWYRITTAALIAAEHINNQDYSVVPSGVELSGNFRLNVTLYDTQSTPIGGLTSLMAARELDTLAVVGPGRSAVSSPVTLLASVDATPVVSYWAASTSLSDTGLYPNFARTYPSDAFTAVGMAASVAAFGWTQVAFLYPDDFYGTGFATDFQAAAPKYGITVLTANKYDYGSAESIGSAVEAVAISGARIICALVFDKDIEKTANAAYAAGLVSERHVWFTADTLVYSDLVSRFDDPVKMQDFYHGMIRLLYLSGFGDGWDAFQKGWVSESTSAYNQHYEKLDLSLPDATFDLACPDLCGPSYDAVWVVAKALDAADDASDGKAVFESMTNTIFKGASNIVDLDDIGDRKDTGSRLFLENFRRDGPTGGKFAAVGIITPEDGLTYIQNEPIVWRSGTSIVPQDVLPVLDQLISITPALKWFVMALLSFTLLLCLGILVFQFVYRKNRIIISSSPRINTVIVLGAPLILGYPLVLSMESTNDANFVHLCNARIIVMLLGSGMCYSPLFAKTYRLTAIFTQKQLGRRAIKDKQLYTIIAIFFLVDSLLALLWTASCPYSRKSVYSALEGPFVVNDEEVMYRPYSDSCYCPERNMWLGIALVYKFCVMVWGSYLAHKGKSIPIKAFNDSYWIGLSIYNAMIICLVVVPVTYLVVDQPDAHFGLVGVGVWVLITATILLIFLPKMIATMTGRTDMFVTAMSNTPSPHAREKHRELNSGSPTPSPTTSPRTNTKNTKSQKSKSSTGPVNSPRVSALAQVVSSLPPNESEEDNEVKKQNRLTIPTTSASVSVSASAAHGAVVAPAEVKEAEAEAEATVTVRIERPEGLEAVQLEEELSELKRALAKERRARSGVEGKLATVEDQLLTLKRKAQEDVEKWRRLAGEVQDERDRVIEQNRSVRDHEEDTTQGLLSSNSA